MKVLYLLMLIAGLLWIGDFSITLKGFDTGIKQCIKILDRNCHSKEINNDETVQNQ